MISLYNLSLSILFVLAYFIEKQFQYWPNQRWYIDNIFKYIMYVRRLYFSTKKDTPYPLAHLERTDINVKIKWVSNISTLNTIVSTLQISNFNSIRAATNHENWIKKNQHPHTQGLNEPQNSKENTSKRAVLLWWNSPQTVPPLSFIPRSFESGSVSEQLILIRLTLARTDDWKLVTEGWKISILHVQEALDILYFCNEKCPVVK